MSIQWVARVLELDTSVAGANRLVLISLANHANEDGWCWPKRETIAREAGLKKLDTVTERLSWLVAHDLILRDVNGWAGETGQLPKDQRPNLYRLTLPDCPQAPRPTGTRRTGTRLSRAPRHTGRGAPRHTGTRGSPPHGDQNHQEEPSVEPSAAPRSSSATPRARRRAVDDDSDSTAPPTQDPTAATTAALALAGIDGGPTPGEIGYVAQALARNPGREAAVVHDLIRRAQLAATARKPRAYMATALIELSMVDQGF